MYVARMHLIVIYQESLCLAISVAYSMYLVVVLQVELQYLLPHAAHAREVGLSDRLCRYLYIHFGGTHDTRCISDNNGNCYSNTSLFTVCS